MKEDQASTTAWIVAWMRAVGTSAPPALRVAEDPYARLFLPAALRKALEAGDKASPLRRLAESTTAAISPELVYYLPLRTRAIDDALLDFLRAGGKQVLVLGAGYDARAYRFAAQLHDAQARVFEVDHPATQRRKLEMLAGAELPETRVEHVPFDFEQGVDKLPAALDAHGFSPSERTFAIWEGVTMYLTEPAIEATLAMLRGCTPPGSELCFTYFDVRYLHGRRGIQLRLLVRAVGEPLRFGWDPGHLPEWMQRHGWELLRDDEGPTLATRYIPAASGWWRRVAPFKHVALARRLP